LYPREKAVIKIEFFNHEPTFSKKLKQEEEENE